MKTAGRWVLVLTIGMVLACWLSPTMGKISAGPKTRQHGLITGKVVWGKKPLPAGLVLTITLTEKLGGRAKTVKFHSTIGQGGAFTVKRVVPGAYSVWVSLTASAAALATHGFGGARLCGNVRQVVVRAGMKVDVGTVKLVTMGIH